MLTFLVNAWGRIRDLRSNWNTKENSLWDTSGRAFRSSAWNFQEFLKIWGERERITNLPSYNETKNLACFKVCGWLIFLELSIVEASTTSSVASISATLSISKTVVCSQCLWEQLTAEGQGSQLRKQITITRSLKCLYKTAILPLPWDPFLTSQHYLHYYSQTDKLLKKYLPSLTTVPRCICSSKPMALGHT